MLSAFVRPYLAILIVGAVAAAVGVALVAILGLLGPDSMLVQRQRLPGWWIRFTAWARSRSLRVWCPDPATARAIAAHLATPTGRRLSRLGVTLVPTPGDADVIVLARAERHDLDRWRAHAPTPTASVVLRDPEDLDEFTDAIARLAAALRWPHAAERLEP